MADVAIVPIPDSDIELDGGLWSVAFFRIASYGCGTGDDPVEVEEQGVAVTHRDYLRLDE